MCCGSNRLQFLRNSIMAPWSGTLAAPPRPNSTLPAIPAPAPASLAHATPAQARGPAGSMPSRFVPYVPQFEYTGRTALTVAGPATRHTYYFDRPGARLAVDPRDSPSLAAIPVLRRLR